MARADYAHWNEEADARWWAEEGQFEGRPEYDEYDPDDYLPADEDEEYDDVDDVFPDSTRHEDNDEGGEDSHLEAAYEDQYGVNY